MFTLAIVVLVVGAIILQGTKYIPADPPHLGQTTRLGKRIVGKYYKEGWGFYLFYPYLVGFIPVKVDRIPFEVVSETTRTLDRAVSKVPVLLTFRPIPEMLIQYLDSGGEEGVKKQLAGKVKERIREWAMSREEGPADWIELNQSQVEAVSLLVKKIALCALPIIPENAQSIPTWIWMRFFARPQPTQHLQNEEPWAANDWQRVRAVLNVLSPGEAITLKAAIASRRESVEKLRAGEGDLILPNLGIKLERLNIGDIDVLGGVAEQAEGEAKEEQERKKDELELRFVRERIAELMAPPFDYSKEQARDIVQVERGKVVRAIDDKQISLDASTATIIATVLGGRMPLV